MEGTAYAENRENKPYGRDRYGQEYSEGYGENGGQEHERSVSNREFREDPPIEQSFQRLNFNDVRFRNYQGLIVAGEPRAPI